MNSISIIIPVLDNPADLMGALDNLMRLARVEVIVVKGGARDPQFADLEKRFPHVRWLYSPAGRGRQMNAGASDARGEWLVFLHADTRLPSGWLEELDSAAHDPLLVGGCFRFQLDAKTPWARLIERGVALRVRWLNLPYGDQALFVRRDVFESLSGYRDLALMEDVEFVRRLTKAGRLYYSALPALTSARRWETDGWIRRSMENVALIILYFLGVPPQRLARLYRREQQKHT